MCPQGCGTESSSREARGLWDHQPVERWRSRFVRRPASVGWIAVVLMGSVACAEFEIGYFQGRVNETTEHIVVKRYGPPHIEQR